MTATMTGVGILPRTRAGTADAALWALVAAYALGLVASGPAFDPLVDGWLSNLTTALPGLLLLSRGRRRGGPAGRELALLGTGALLWTLGGLNTTLAAAQHHELPFPSWGDVCYLAFPVLVFVSLISRIRREHAGTQAAVWLDGAVGACGAATLVAVLVGPLVSGTGGSFDVAVAAAYPLSDLVLLAVISGITVARGFRPGRSWLWLQLGLTVFTAADVLYALRVSHGSYVVGTPLDALWSIGLTAVATGARSSPRSRRAGEVTRERWQLTRRSSALTVPALATAAALTVLVLGRWVDVPPVAVLLAAVTLLVAAVRTQLAFLQVVRLFDLGRQARTDSLTGLGNRRALHEHLERRLAGEVPEPLAVLLVDLDHFKEINDALGHHVGDELLRQIGPRILPALRDADLVVRLGGDEFAVVVDTGSGECPEQVANRLLDELVEPFHLDDVPLRVGASIGIALVPDDSSDTNGLLQRADVAMYAAKADGGGVRRYDPARDQHSRERLRTIEELRVALSRGELTVHYQPQRDVATGAVRGVEALVRWQHPERGLLAPDTFLPLAEQTGLMPALTAEVLGQSVRQCLQWRSAGLDVGVSVNVSASSLLDQRLPEEVSWLLASTGLPPCALTLELTENTLMADPEQCRETLARLSGLGVWLSIDDYGTGYCSLSYLQNLPVDELKLDRAFLHDLTEGRNAAIVRSTIDLAHALGLRMVAEGVEDEPSLDLLRRLGCDTAQGYHLSRPLPPEATTRWLHQHCDVPAPVES